jgi:hypothetical protein
MDDTVSRLNYLDSLVGRLSAAVAAMQAQVGSNTSAVQQLGYGGMPIAGAGVQSITWAYANTGIGAATVTGSVGGFTLTADSANCDLYQFNGGSQTWTFLGSKTVYNDWPNSGGAGVPTGFWAQVYQDPAGNWRTLGNQC